jgi:hypothetical protein
MVEIGVHSYLIFDVRKETNGLNINLNQTELAQMKAMGLPARLNWIWGAHRNWVHRDLGLMVPMADMVLALMPPSRQSKKLSNLKLWLGAPVISGLLGKVAM